MTMLKVLMWIYQRPMVRGLARLLLPRSVRLNAMHRAALKASENTRFVRTPNWKVELPPVGLQNLPGESRHGERAGINVFGYLRGQFGLAESARYYARALMEAGTPVALVDLELDLPHGWQDDSLQQQLGEVAPYPVSLIFVNPDYFEEALQKIGPERLKHKHLIACWFWELETIPSSWLPVIERVDEILVASEFVAGAFRRVTSKPVLCVPLPVGGPRTSELTRADFGLEEDSFIFLCTFDFNSWIARKNPQAAIDAFKLAFPDDPSVRLLLKTINGHRHVEAFQRFLDQARSDPRILVRDDLIDGAHVGALQRCCDVYVSLHRAEGFGLGMAESMWLGKPVMATGWSGNMEFMDAGSAALVDYRLEMVGEGEYPHEAGDRWATADVRDAARHMRRLMDDPDLRHELAKAGSAKVHHVLSPQRCASLINARIAEVMSGKEKPDGGCGNA
ncbi:MAG: glycosyltransferase family 4 protein [Stenotrophomonas maltophilia]|uniref:glycosyltransferase family 4 protein n=2 Tax=Lysobacteraceae TaxID=32033 RepID=UPI00128E6F4C|nr:glycosyltransferase family 4 protein [Stenotrophomonas maltophilia]MBS4801889.1 glycosyltransferase family 4 protein [Stenotrophomonas maltophilia]HDX0899079.1 glycosyltransferase family 4 protein [Stenotrophomonas maltophilia]HDX0918390.1 glycosyltransferase family 4 protein [Stenotrophomonas maltophilia]HEL4138056.1 glycosyltransferase family 4 protein [Stenotrophomonas maltophilia]HEL5321417.1 glycosyltransferase family 4 protein [Stenotrophomonas maltophilia]